MARCGCSGSTCGCRVTAGHGVEVRGAGSIDNPYVIDAYPLSITVQDSSSIDLTLTGTGTPSDPYVISGEVAGPGIDGKWDKWSGTQAEYDALGSTDPDTLYLIIEE